MNKRVLIVDDDEEILRMLEFSLKKLGSDYEITTAAGSVEALTYIERQTFDLVVTDYMMKGMTGIDLARAIRRIAPGTQVVLMTAYGTRRLRDTTEYLGFDGYLNKPFTVQQIRDLVKQAVEFAHRDSNGAVPGLPVITNIARTHMEALQVNTNARCVLLLSSDGEPVYVTGERTNLEINNISALIAANFKAAAKLASLLGNETIFKSSFFEGSDYNFYAYDINGRFLLAVVFDARRKPGVVWFYTKQTANILVPLLATAAQASQMDEEA